MYHLTREGGGSGPERWQRFRDLRDELFAEYPSSPLELEDRKRFTGVPYFPYDAAARVCAEVEDAPGEPFRIALRDDGPLCLARVGRLSFELRGRAVRLAVYRVRGYGGGLFLPFRDATAGDSTYGGGRYLIDTVKHADLGTEDGRIVLDFNFAYHPSCVYSPRWECPLAPLENRLDVPIEAGERLPDPSWLASGA